MSLKFIGPYHHVTGAMQ